MIRCSAVRVLAPLALVGVTASLAGCGGDEAPAVFGAAAAWSRPTPAGATNGVLYVTITSDVDDELVGVDVPATIAGTAELHETMVADDGASHHGSGDGGEVMSMGEVESLPIDGGSTVSFEPGGNHVMLVDLTAPLETGDTYTATFRFSSGRTLDVDVVVADNPPG